MKDAKAIVFGDNIDTDQIIATPYLTMSTIAVMAEHAFQHHQQFTGHFRRGDFLVAGSNFGCGSSREQAPAVLKERGVAAIVAVSFARIFFRNAINLGLRLIESPAIEGIFAGDRLKVEGNRLYNLTTGVDWSIEPLPGFLQAILDRGGLIASLREEDGCR